MFAIETSVGTNSVNRSSVFGFWGKLGFGDRTRCSESSEFGLRFGRTFRTFNFRSHPSERHCIYRYYKVWSSVFGLRSSGTVHETRPKVRKVRSSAFRSSGCSVFGFFGGSFQH